MSSHLGALDCILQLTTGIAQPVCGCSSARMLETAIHQAINNSPQRCIEHDLIASAARAAATVGSTSTAFFASLSAPSGRALPRVSLASASSSSLTRLAGSGMPANLYERNQHD